jgi:hypothetical protein
MIRPRLSFSLRVVVVLLMLSPSAWAQTPNSPDSSQTPHAAASKPQGPDVLWYGKAPPGWGGVVTDMKLLAPGIGWAKRAGHLYWTKDNGASWTDISPTDSPDSQFPEEAGGLYTVFFLDAHQGWVLLAGCSSDDPKNLLVSLGLVPYLRLRSYLVENACDTSLAGIPKSRRNGNFPRLQRQSNVHRFSPWLGQYLARRRDYEHSWRHPAGDR